MRQQQDILYSNPHTKLRDCKSMVTHTLHQISSLYFTSLHITSLIITLLTLVSYERKREEQNCAIFPRLITFLLSLLLQNNNVMFRLVQTQGRCLRNKCTDTCL